MQEINQDNGTLGVLIKDTAVANNMKAVIRNLDKFSTEKNKVVNKVNSTIANIKDRKRVLN